MNNDFTGNGMFMALYLVTLLFVAFYADNKKLKEVILLQPLKASSPILSRPSGKLTPVMLLLLKKHWAPMVFTPGGMEIFPPVPR